jgi:hypothetical protein
MRKLGALVGLAFFCTAAHGEEKFVAMGTGVSTCGVFAKEYAKNPHEIENYYFNWAQGYMTGRNLSYSYEDWRQLNAISVERQERKLRDYCDAHPLKQFVDAVSDLYDSLPYAQARKP